MKDVRDIVRRLEGRIRSLCRTAIGARVWRRAPLSRANRALAEHVDTRLSYLEDRLKTEIVKGFEECRAGSNGGIEALEDRLKAEIVRGFETCYSGVNTQLRAFSHHLDDRMGDLSSHQQARTDEVLQVRFDHMNEHLGGSIHRYFAHIDQRLEDRFQFGVRSPPRTVERLRILELASLLTPMSLLDHQKIRVGSSHDGGYILADALKGGEALSLGIADDVSWDLSMAERGYRVHQFDHTVEGPPVAHERFAFHKLKITKTPEPGSITISEVLSTLDSVTRPVLKIDIEGDEWGVFEEIDERDLRRFDQIVCEFHGFGQINDDAWFARALNALRTLSRDFVVVHAHANNYGPLLVLGNVPFPDLLEVTFVNRQLYLTVETTERFPGPLDMPNRADRPDIELFDFKFGPSSAVSEATRAVDSSTSCPH